jgi:hypothetical protein
MAVIAVGPGHALGVIIGIVGGAEAETGPSQLASLLPVAQLDAPLGVLDAGDGQFLHALGGFLIRSAAPEWSAQFLDLVLDQAILAGGPLLGGLLEVVAVGLEDQVFGKRLGRHLAVVLP